MSRYPASHPEALDALFAAPTLHQLAADLQPLAGRARRHPLGMHLAYAAMARLFGSANRLDAALTSGSWPRIVERYNRGVAEHGGPRCGPHLPPLTAKLHRYARDWLSCDDVLDVYRHAFTARAVELARQLGLLNPDGPGSRTRPHPSRVISGDGTILRPLYRPEAEIARHDPTVALHHRHDGTHWGNVLVTCSVRDHTPYRRVLLGIDRVHEPGGEAATALALMRRVHQHAGEGIIAAVYDGALRGTHHQQLMRDLGIYVINAVHPIAVDEDEQRRWRAIPLGTWTHQPDGRPCRHTLAIHNGSVHDAAFDDAGQPLLSDPLPRHQVRRYRNRAGHYRFSLGVTVTCPRQHFVAWISPHPQRGDTTHRRPDQLRLLPASDPDYDRLYGLRNDSEAINAEYKRTLPHRRAPARGWQRQLLDFHAWATLNNTLAWWRHSR